MLIRGEQRRHAEIDDLPESIFSRCGWNSGVELLDGLAQAKGQHHLAVTGPLGMGAVVRQIGAVTVRIAHVDQPREGFLFELVFGHRAPPVSPLRIGTSARLM